MKTEYEIQLQIDDLKRMKEQDDVTQSDISEIEYKIGALQWVLGQSSDIFN